MNERVVDIDDGLGCCGLIQCSLWKEFSCVFINPWEKITSFTTQSASSNSPPFKMATPVDTVSTPDKSNSKAPGSPKGKWKFPVSYLPT